MIEKKPAWYFLALIRIQGRHLRAARALIGWSQKQLSEKANVALGSIKRMEAIDGPVRARTDTLDRLIAVLERAGVEFLDEEKPGVRLVKSTKRR